ncbi:MAG TPA: sigma-54-dependent Fis family transcriptional regulator [Anaerovoracaceae bacterium]|nr:sigma-54-dependent Fis family transcriptional regulator [Anaerovoracaceae bacterium]
MGQNSHINYFDNPAQYIKTVKKEWENFISTGSISGLSVRNEILKSWEQSLKNGISYLQDGAKLVLDEKGMSKVYAKNSMLISASQPILVEFADMLIKRGTGGSIINLCDGDTVILKTLSSNSFAKEAAESQHLLPGAILSEQYSGTTGVAMVRNTLQPYAIYGSEHFSIAAKTWCCAAAPIRNIGTRELMGILSLTGENLNVSPDTMGMITFVARTIESEMYSEYVYRSNFLNERFKETILRSKADLILAVDCDLSVISSSKNQHPILFDFYNRRDLRQDIKNLTEKAIEQYLECSHPDQKAETVTFSTFDYTLSFAPVFYQNGLAGVLLYVYPVQHIRYKSPDKHSALPTIVNAPVLVGDHPAFLSALETAKSAAKTDASIILLGETGVGKEGFARTIYVYSNRADKPFVAVNCGAIPKELIGSELFGYAPGAFTGALSKGNPGKIEAANGGTIFLDELGELPLDAQTYLLRALEEKELVRLGSHHIIPIDVRIIAATNMDLQEMVKEKKFRADLYYRLNVVEIKIPPLRERFDDLANLISFFNTHYSGSGCVLNDADLAYLTQYSWPGNVRELKNVIHSANILGKDTVESLRDYVSIHMNQEDKDKKLFNNKKIGDQDRILELIKSCNGNISKAAKQLGVARSTIYRNLK